MGRVLSASLPGIANFARFRSAQALQSADSVCESEQTAGERADPEAVGQGERAGPGAHCDLGAGAGRGHGCPSERERDCPVDMAEIRVHDRAGNRQARCEHERRSERAMNGQTERAHEQRREQESAAVPEQARDERNDADDKEHPSLRRARVVDRGYRIASEQDAKPEREHDDVGRDDQRSAGDPAREEGAGDRHRKPDRQADTQHAPVDISRARVRAPGDQRRRNRRGQR